MVLLQTYFMKLSFVSPVYRAEKIIPALISRIEASAKLLTDDYEIVLVDDFSPDNSWTIIENEAKKNTRVKGLKLSRNFGQHYAISAGLKYATGDWIVVMDCDLQDQPEEVVKLYDKAKEGYDIVYAKRQERNDSFLKKLSSTMFHAVYDYLSGQKTDKTVANFGIYNKAVIDELNKMPEVARFFPSLVGYVGFRHASVNVEHAARYEGKSSYSLSKLLKLTFDVIILNSNKPLRLAVKIGFSLSTVAFILAIYNIIAYFAGIIMVPGYTTTIFSIWFVGGLILFILGIIGIYIGKIFDQVKGRQLYIIEKKLNIE